MFVSIMRIPIFCLLLLVTGVQSFSPTSSTSSLSVSSVASLSKLFSSTSDDVVLFSSAEQQQQDDDKPKNNKNTNMKKSARWHSLNPKVKERIIKEQQAKAIANKKKREPKADKQRRMMMYYKKAQGKKKLSNKTARPISIRNENRISLSSLQQQAQDSSSSSSSTYQGTVISLTDFGAYIDIGTECDGLLHISQITREEFISHPKQVFSPGDVIDGLKIYRIAPEMKKLQLTLLDSEEEENGDEDELALMGLNNNSSSQERVDPDRIPLEDIQIDDELWGEIKRVTNFGSYIEVGCEVYGFLHFMDHPFFGLVKEQHPSEYMRVGDRVRVWVSNLDFDKKRVQLTAMRPKTLPILRRERF